MPKDPAFLFYPGDYLRDTQCLSENVQVAYDRIMCEHMRNICIRQEQLDFFTKKLTGAEKQELLMVLTKTSDGFQITWVAESICKRRDYSESRRKNRTSKQPKDMINISKSYDEHMEIENINVNKDSKRGVGKKEGIWNQMPGKTELDLPLPEIKNGAVVQLFQISKGITISETQVDQLWDVFKKQNFTGKKFYQSDQDTFSHFINWSKTQNINNGTISKHNSGNSKSAGVNEVAERFAAKLAARGKTDS